MTSVLFVKTLKTALRKDQGLCKTPCMYIRDAYVHTSHTRTDTDTTEINNVNTCIHTYIHMYIRTYIHADIYIYIYTTETDNINIFTYMHTHTYIHAYVHT